MVAKKGNRWRKVQDYRELSKETEKIHFKMDCIQSVMDLMQPGIRKQGQMGSYIGGNQLNELRLMDCIRGVGQKLGFKEFELERISSSTDGYQEDQGISDAKYNTIDINRQRISEIPDKKMEGEELTVEDCKEVERSLAMSENRIQGYIYSRSIEYNCGRVKQVGNEWRLLFETESVQLSSDTTEISSSDLWLHESNEQTVNRILQRSSGQKRISSQLVQLFIDQPHDISTSTDSKDIKNINQVSERQSSGNADCTQMEGINMVRDVEEHVEEESSSGSSEPSSRARGDYDKQSIEETTSRSVGSKLGDRKAEGEQLLRQIASYVGLEEHTVMNIINSFNPETQGKRRAGILLLSNYVKEKQIPMEQILSKKADILLSNALTWREPQGGNHMLEDLRKIKTHVGMVLSMFSSQVNVGKSPIIIALQKRLELDREQKSKYAVVWNLQMSLDYVRRTGLGSG
ncbi:MAG: hypothetical protein EZS28_031827 [Streblomastix strix]|uniref:Uncharacterized protein n=1 Tax=Streblomastix strix TaxID=222440 RepID=A0A5J4UQG2_9EUKA|nr:MAG: hypothetical protein EZS28_031827 [Streblomastix strix]